MRDFFKSLIAPMLVALLVAGGANAAVWQWSHTAASNATADASINWSEGMAPSAVNDSARAMMARLADWRDDNSGLLATAGTATAYTVTTNQGLGSTPQNGQLLAVTMHATNGASPTLAADGGTAYPIQSAPAVAVTSGTLVLGSPYTMKFSTSTNAWMLHNYYGTPLNVPLGALLPYTGSLAPSSNYILPAGQCISRTTYAAYFTLVGTTYGTCDGVSTFGVIDMRGRGPSGIDNLNGTDAGRLTGAFGCNGTTLGAGCGSQSFTISQAMIPNYVLPNTLGISDTTNYTVNNGGNLIQDGAGSKYGGGGVGNAVNVTLTKTGVVSITGGVTSGGSGTAGAMLMPLAITSYILRVL